MKRYLFITLLILTVNSFSQNWNIIKPNNTYHYALENVYDVSVYANSVNTNGTDSTFLMNKIVLPCDTCSDELYGALLINQSTFLQHKIVKDENVYRFYGNGSFAILPNAELNETWLFDTLNNVTAEIVLETNETIIWGVDDAVKYIKLSNNDTIIISKNYGIIRFDAPNRSYRLIGVETPTENIGYAIPKFADFFDFEVGDILQYRSIECTGNTSEDFIKYKKYTVLEKMIKGDSLVYVVNKQYASGITAYCMDTLLASEDNYYTTSTDTIIFIDSATHFTNLYNHELYTASGSFMGTDTTFYEHISCYLQDGKMYKTYASNSNSTAAPCYFAHSEHSNLILPLPMGTYTASIQSAYCVGLGLVYSEKEFFESVLREELIGYVKNNNTVGTVYDNSFYSSVENLTNRKKIAIYPNPAQGQVRIKGLDINEVTSVRLLDTKGVELYKGKELSIKLENYPPSLYFVAVQYTNGEVDYLKLMVK